MAWCQVPGGAYAEQIVLKQGDAVPIGDDLPDDVAAAVLVQGLTAHYLTKSVYAVGPGDTALVHTAAGGSGAMITQVVKLLGGRVIAAVSTPEKEAVAREAGADDVINYGTADVAAEARRLTDGEGVSVVYDGTGQSTFKGSMAALRRRGTMVLYGSSSGPVPPVDVQRVLRGGLFLTRPSMPDYISTREERLPPINEVLGWLRDGHLKVRIGGRYPLADAARAHHASSPGPPRASCCCSRAEGRARPCPGSRVRPSFRFARRDERERKGAMVGMSTVDRSAGAGRP